MLIIRCSSDEPAEIAADIGATNIFVGPNGLAPPSSEPCISGPVGAPIPASMTAPNAACPISFTPQDTGDSCVTGGVPALMSLCKVVMIPLTPQQPHYLVVYHNMSHTNGGLAFKETFNRFAEKYFRRQPGCDGLQFNCNSD